MFSLGEMMVCFFFWGGVGEWSMMITDEMII